MLTKRLKESKKESKEVTKKNGNWISMNRTEKVQTILEDYHATQNPQSINVLLPTGDRNYMETSPQ